LLIDDDLNDLLDREIKPLNDVAEWGLWENNQLKGGSTHVSMMHKSPLDAYTDQSDFHHTLSCHPSQQSSFDDSFTETLNPYMS